MAGKKSKSRSGKRKSKSKSSKGKYRRCRGTDKLHPGWDAYVPGPTPGMPRSLREVQGLYKDALGLKQCRQFNTAAIPCKYMPRAMVNTYAAQCKIKGRSKKSQKALCRSLARRTGAKPFSSRCANKRVLDLIVARNAAGLPVDDLKMRAFHRLLKSGGIGSQFGASKDQLKALILSKEAEIREVQRMGKAKLAAVKSETKSTTQDLEAEKKRLEAQLTTLQKERKSLEAEMSQYPATFKPSFNPRGTI